MEREPLERLQHIVAHTSAQLDHWSEPIRGTAFLITRTHALTCAHCLGQKGNGTWARTVTLYFSRWGVSGGTCAAEVVGEPDWERDVTILKLAGPAGEDIVLLNLALNGSRQARWDAFAHPTASRDAGILLGGKVRDPAARLPNRPLPNHVIQLRCDEGQDSIKGASGGPVVVNEVVIGMLNNQLVEEKTLESYSPHGPKKYEPIYDTVYAVPCEAIQDALHAACPQLQLLPPAEVESIDQKLMNAGKRLYQRVGLLRFLALALLVFALATWWRWDKIRILPGMPTLLTWLSQEALPKADPQRFTVAVAHLDNDPDRQHERLLVEALQEIEGIHILRFDRTISLAGSQPEQSVKAGHDRARAYLEESGAHVLIWGTVLVGGNRSLPKLYWTPTRELELKKEFGRYQPTEDLNLPSIFWSDLGDILGLLVSTYSAEFHAQEGHFVADKLSPFIERVRRLVDASKRQERWSTETRAEIQFILAGSLQTLGEQTGRNEPLEEAVGTYHEVLQEYTRERVPLQWATTQNNLGTALSRLGERESGTARLEEAVTAYQEALQERTRERVPLDWAATQNNLGIALRALGERKQDAALICEALGNHLMVWEIFVEAAPYYAAMARDNVDKDITALKQLFPAAIYEACLSKHAELLKRMGVS